MDLDEIKRGLRAEIKKRENEQYFTFQCNVRQMCKDVLAKLEEQESEIAEKDKVIEELEESHKNEVKQLLILNSEQANAANRLRNSMEQVIFHQKYKRCLAMARVCRLRARWFGDNAFYKKEQWALQWHKRWLELAEKFKEAK